MSEIVNLPMLAFIFGFGAFAISLICLYQITKKPNHQYKKVKKPNKLFAKKEPFVLRIRPEFIEEARSEREHRMAQRKKYGIFDENGNRIDKP